MQLSELLANSVDFWSIFTFVFLVVDVVVAIFAVVYYSTTKGERLGWIITYGVFAGLVGFLVWFATVQMEAEAGSGCLEGEQVAHFSGNEEHGIGKLCRDTVSGKVRYADGRDW